MALVFPTSPVVGQKYPADPGISGVTQYIYTGSRWNAVPSVVSLGTANQGVYNQYQWPAADGSAGNQLTTDGAGNLTWDVAAAPSMLVLGILPSELPFDGVNTVYTLVDSTTLTPYAPTPSSNIVVFLGGVPQTPTTAYSVTGSTITFLGAPLAGTTFYAITNVII
jgi:hypothetical protein